MLEELARLERQTVKGAFRRCQWRSLMASGTLSYHYPRALSNIATLHYQAFLPRLLAKLTMDCVNNYWSEFCALLFLRGFSPSRSEEALSA